MVRLLLVPEPMIKRVAIALFFALSLLVLPAPPLPAQTLDPAAAAALATTLRMLADPAARGQILATDPTAAAIDKQVQGLAGSSQLAEEVYGLAAEVFADLARSSGGDPGRLSEALDRAKTDPAGFAAMLRPETLERLRALATKISDAQR
ncbi:MAG TPA: hypothetical protein VK878_00430 [Candidatus Deferrimicrobiaceae bacterium]|nr:hypothetical protein [Candidatus Deferrimicrobiaceae bacterium]